MPLISLMSNETRLSPAIPCVRDVAMPVQPAVNLDPNFMVVQPHEGIASLQFATQRLELAPVAAWYRQDPLRHLRARPDHAVTVRESNPCNSATGRVLGVVLQRRAISPAMEDGGVAGDSFCCPPVAISRLVTHPGTALDSRLVSMSQ